MILNIIDCNESRWPGPYLQCSTKQSVPDPLHHFGPYNSSKRFGGTVTLRSNQLTLIVLHLFKKKKRTFLSPEDRSHAIFNWTHTSKRWELSEVIAFEWLKNDPRGPSSSSSSQYFTVRLIFQKSRICEVFWYIGPTHLEFFDVMKEICSTSRSWDWC